MNEEGFTNSMKFGDDDDGEDTDNESDSTNYTPQSLLRKLGSRGKT